MLVDLNPLPYRTAIETIKWCYEREIDKSQCEKLLLAFGSRDHDDVEWVLDIPDQYVTFLLLKWKT